MQVFFHLEVVIKAGSIAYMRHLSNEISDKREKEGITLRG